MSDTKWAVGQRRRGDVFASPVATGKPMRRDVEYLLTESGADGFAWSIRYLTPGPDRAMVGDEVYAWESWPSELLSDAPAVAGAPRGPVTSALDWLRRLAESHLAWDPTAVAAPWAAVLRLVNDHAEHAAERERLQRDREEWRALASAVTDERDAARAESARLRAALEGMKCPACNGTGDESLWWAPGQDDETYDCSNCDGQGDDPRARLALAVPGTPATNPTEE